MVAEHNILNIIPAAVAIFNRPIITRLYDPVKYILHYIGIYLYAPSQGLVWWEDRNNMWMCLFFRLNRNSFRNINDIENGFLLFIRRRRRATSKHNVPWIMCDDIISVAPVVSDLCLYVHRSRCFITFFFLPIIPIAI